MRKMIRCIKGKKFLLSLLGILVVIAMMSFVNALTSEQKSNLDGYLSDLDGENWVIKIQNTLGLDYNYRLKEEKEYLINTLISNREYATTENILKAWDLKIGTADKEHIEARSRLYSSLTDENKKKVIEALDEKGRLKELWDLIPTITSSKQNEIINERTIILRTLTAEKQEVLLSKISGITITGLKIYTKPEEIGYKIEVNNFDKVTLNTQSGEKLTIPLEDLPEGLKEYNVIKELNSGKTMAVVVFGENKDPDANRVFLRNGEYVSATRFSSLSDKGKEDFDVNDENGKYLFSANFRGTSKNQIFNDNGKYQMWGNGHLGEGATLRKYDEQRWNSDKKIVTLWEVSPNKDGAKTSKEENYAFVQELDNGVRLYGNYLDYKRGFSAVAYKDVKGSVIDFSGTHQGNEGILYVEKNGNIISFSANEDSVGKFAFKVGRNIKAEFDDKEKILFTLNEKKAWVPRFNAGSQHLRPSPQIGQRQPDLQQPSSPRREIGGGVGSLGVERIGDGKKGRPISSEARNIEQLLKGIPQLESSDRRESQKGTTEEENRDVEVTRPNSRGGNDLTKVLPKPYGRPPAGITPPASCPTCPK